VEPSARRRRFKLKYFAILLIFRLMMHCILNGQCSKCRALRKAASRLPNCNSTIHYTHFFAHSPLSLCEGFSVFLIFLFFLFRSASVVEKPFYGKLCCILSGNDAHPAASHPGHKMATPLCFSFTEKYLHIHLKKQNTNFQPGKDKRQMA